MLVNTSNVAVFEPSTAIDIQQVPELKHNDMSTKSGASSLLNCTAFRIYAEKERITIRRYDSKKSYLFVDRQYVICEELLSYENLIDMTRLSYPINPAEK